MRIREADILDLASNWDWPRRMNCFSDYLAILDQLADTVLPSGTGLCLTTKHETVFYLNTGDVDDRTSD